MSNKDSVSQIVLRGAGMDCVFNLIQDGHIRPIEVGGRKLGSLVDVVSVFAGVKNPRQYWKDHKKQLLSKNPLRRNAEADPELVANLYQLKLKASDGKSYKTDVAPLWVCVYVAMTINAEFRKRMAKFTAAEIKYRMGNVSRGFEWAADTIRESLDWSTALDESSDVWTELGNK